MEVYLTIIIATVLGLLFYKRKSEKAEIESKLAEIKGKDSQLEITQDELEAAIAEIDSNIEKLRKAREAEERKVKEDNMTLKERAERIKKGIK